MLVVARTACLILFSTLLSGCLIVEAVGPVAGARVSISRLQGGPNLTPDFSTAGVEEARDIFGEENWEGYDEATRMLLVGGVQLPRKKFEPASWYLITVSGGTDLDADGNRRLDSPGRAVARDLHAIVTGAQIKKKGSIRVNLLTEVIYQGLSWQLADMNSSQLEARLEEAAQRLVPDVNGDGGVDYSDVLAWSATDSNHPYLGNPLFLERMQRALFGELYEDIIFELDAINVLAWSGLQVSGMDRPYSDRLIPCATPVVLADLCTFGELPLLGEGGRTPTIDQVMDRVMVSHPWMATRFREVLSQMPDDIFLLFRSVKSIVIDANVRPAHWDGVAATMFLDPAFLWLTPEELLSVSSEPDFRAEFGYEMAFTELWRYVKNNDYAPPLPPPWQSSRSLDDITVVVAALLFHELAHAVDTFRPENLALLQPWQLTIDAYYYTISEELNDESPLESLALRGVADVFFKGFAPTSTERNYTARQIGNMFNPDGASDLYAFHSIWEDSAMLFEEAMMAIHFGVQRDIAFTSVPASDVPAEDIACSDFVVGWGVRGRLTAPSVLPRARRVVSGFLPERSYRDDLNSLPKSIPMRVGADWCENLVLGHHALARPAGAMQMTAPPRHGARSWR